MKSSRTGETLTIGQTAERFGLAPHVLRHWESVGLLEPARAVAERRRYGRDDLYRIAVILRAKEAGFGLDDIAEILTTTEPGARRKALLRRQTELVQRIEAATASLDLVERALDCDHDDFMACPNFQAAVLDRIGPHPLPSPLD